MNDQKRDILCTGGSGYIGSHCILELVARGEQVIVVDVNENDLNDTINYYFDIRDTDKLSQVFQKHNIGTVIHFAAYKSVNESCNNPLKYYDNNINGLLSVLKCMELHHVSNIIFSSSATVYGIPESLPLTEESRISPINPYGRTKYFAEEILRDSKCRAICLRYFNPVGVHPLLEPERDAENLFPIILSVIEGKREHLKIYGSDYDTPDGTAVRDYIHVVDLAKGHAAALDYFPHFENFEVFNLGTGQGYSVMEIVKKYRDYGYDVPYILTDRREGDAPEVYADCSKANKLLKWAPSLTLHDMI